MAGFIAGPRDGPAATGRLSPVLMAISWHGGRFGSTAVSCPHGLRRAGRVHRAGAASDDGVAGRREHGAIQGTS